MTRTRRDERFRWYVKRFLEREGIEGREIRSRTSGSSFLVEDPEGAARELRVVELLRPPEGGDRESVRAFRRSLAREAERRWKEREDRPDVEVWVEFSGHEQTTAARDRTELAGTLCSLVEDALPAPDGFVRVVRDDPAESEDFPLAISGLTVARLREYTVSSWHVAGSAPAAGLDPDGIRAAVRRAPAEAAPEEEPGGSGGESADADRVPDHVWLVLVVDSFRLTGEPAIPDEVTEEEYESSFDRIVLFDPVRGEVTALRSAQPDRGA